MKRKILFLSFAVLSFFLISAVKNNNTEIKITTNGFADANGGISGGINGESVTVTEQFALKEALNDNETRTIIISGNINLEEGRWTTVGSNKTIIGTNNAALRYGGFLLKGVSNVIIKNIIFSDALTLGSGTEYDSISILDGSSNIWIDHCTFSDDPDKDLSPAKHHDGLIDIKTGSSFITVSYCEFHNHDKTSLLGHSDDNFQDRGKLKVTYHHNFFNGTEERHPRVRFGEAHVYNNYYLSNTIYAIGCGYEAKIYSEKNYFENTQKPFEYIKDKDGFLKDVGSFFVNSGSPVTKESGVNWKPEKYYPYKIDDAKDVKEICIKYAGAGKKER